MKSKRNSSENLILRLICVLLLNFFLINQIQSQFSHYESMRRKRMNRKRDNEQIESIKYKLGKIKRLDSSIEDQTLDALEKMKERLTGSTKKQKLKILSDDEIKLEKLKREKKKLEKMELKRKNSKKKKKNIRLKHIKDQVDQTLDSLIHKKKASKVKNQEQDDQIVNKKKNKKTLRSNFVKKVQLDYKELSQKFILTNNMDTKDIFTTFEKLSKNHDSENLLENKKIGKNIELDLEIENKQFKQLSEIKKTWMTDFLDTGVVSRDSNYWKLRGKIYTKSKLQQEFESYKASELLRKLGLNATYNSENKEEKKDTDDSGFKEVGGLSGMDIDMGQDTDDDGLNLSDGKSDLILRFRTKKTEDEVFECK
jgi:hypothetical protein